MGKEARGAKAARSDRSIESEKNLRNQFILGGYPSYIVLLPLSSIEFQSVLVDYYGDKGMIVVHHASCSLLRSCPTHVLLF